METLVDAAVGAACMTLNTTKMTAKRGRNLTGAVGAVGTGVGLGVGGC
jgi:hypothetical protein